MHMVEIAEKNHFFSFKYDTQYDCSGNDKV